MSTRLIIMSVHMYGGVIHSHKLVDYLHLPTDKAWFKTISSRRWHTFLTNKTALIYLIEINITMNVH